MRKEIYIQVATLLPLINAGKKMKKDIMDEAENNYLNLNHRDFSRTILDGKTAMRKREEWVIQQAFEQGLIQRTNKKGEYHISKKGSEFIEDFAANVDINKNTASRYYTQRAIYLLESIYGQNETLIAERQAGEVRKMLGI